MTDMLRCAVSALVLVLSCLGHPRHGRCPARYYVTGIRPSGAFSCRPEPVGDPDHDGVWGRPDVSVQPPGEYRAQIYCTGGAHPIVVDQRTVGCTR